MRSRGVSFAPSAGTSPLICSRPSRIQRSTSRREPMPAADSSFCTRSRRRLIFARRLPAACVAALGSRHQFGSSCAPRATRPVRPRRRRSPRPGRSSVRVIVRVGRRRSRRRSPPAGRRRRALGRRPTTSRLRARQGQLHPQILEFLELRQRRQVIEFLQAEVVEKLPRGAQQFRLARAHRGDRPPGSSCARAGS